MTTDKAVVKESPKLSGVWIIPLLALVLGASVVIHNWMTQGPTIEIAFKTAEGLEPGKTKIKYRDVEMGVVETVSLSEDLQGVVATAKLSRQALPMLREDTRFWVVTARVGIGNVTGLDTLLSGAYIQLSPGESPVEAESFVALEQPPLTPLGAPGLRLQLISQEAASVSTGDAVLYKGYKVGRVESATFDPQAKEVRYIIFIDAPYHTLVSTGVRFFNVSGVSMSLNAEGINVDTGSIETILLGGVAFELPEGVAEGNPVENNAEFSLYPSYEAVLQNPHTYGTHYVVMFGQSIKGLLPGAPVEYRGLRIGEVKRILLKEAMERNMEEERFGRGDPIAVLIYLEPARMEMPDAPESVDVLRKAIQAGIKNGMRASLETGNLLTGAMYVGVDYFENAEPVEPQEYMGFDVVPSIQTGIGQLQYQLSSILDKVQNLPLEETVANVNSAIASLDRTIGEVETMLASDGAQNLPADLDATLTELRKLLRSYSPGSPGYESINSSLLQLNRTLNNFRAITDTLADQPNKIVFPADPADDPIPEAKQ